MNEQVSSRKAANIGMFVAIYAVYFVLPDMGYIMPALNNIAKATGVDAAVASYLSTSVAVSQILSAIAAGFIAGRKIKYKTLLMVSLIGMTVFGILPGVMAATTPFWVFIAIRIVFGLFLGSLMPVINATVLSTFSDKGKRASVFGVGNAFFNVGAIFGLLVGGVLAAQSWNGSFWLYGVNAIAAVFVGIGYKEPQTYEEKAKGAKVRIPGIAWFYTIAFAVANIGWGATNTMVANIMDTHQLGNAALAGGFLAMAVGIGVVVSLLFAALFKGLKKWTLVVAGAVAAAGYLLAYSAGVSGGLVLFAIAIIAVGFGHTMLTVGTPQFTGLSVSPAAYTAAMAMAAVFWQVGNFLASPFTQAVGAVFNTTDYIYIFPVIGVMLVVLTVLYGVVAKTHELRNPEADLIEMGGAVS
ncbi:MAG: MFS transporter [Coriobacteriia bacterium]